MNANITEKLFSMAACLANDEAELLETAGAALDRLNAENAELRADLEKVKKIAIAHMDRLPARLNTARMAGRNEAKQSWEEGWEFGRKCEQQMKDENATFTAEIMKYEAELEAVKQELENASRKIVEIGTRVDVRLSRAIFNRDQIAIAITDKESALKELGEAREYLAIEVGPEMWHLDEVDRAILTERTRCAEIAKSYKVPGVSDKLATGSLIARAIMEEPK